MDELDIKLLDDIFCSNLGCRDEYLAFAVKWGLPNYCKLYSREIEESIRGTKGDC